MAPIFIRIEEASCLGNIVGVKIYADRKMELKHLELIIYGEKDDGTQTKFNEIINSFKRLDTNFLEPLEFISDNDSVNIKIILKYRNNVIEDHYRTKSVTLNNMLEYKNGRTVIPEDIRRNESKKKIFINYARENFEQAKKLYDTLIEYFNVWFDKESLLAGQDWQSEIENAIKKSDRVILLFSSNSVNKIGRVQKEYKLALDVLETYPYGKIFIIPVRLDKCEIPLPFKRYQYIDLFPDWDQGVRKIFQSINSS